MISWNNIDTLFLDMDGTILDLHYDNFFWNQYLPRRYAEIHAVEQDHAARLLSDHYERKLGTLDWYCIDYWSATLGLDIPALKREVSGMIRYRDSAPDFLEAIGSFRCRKVIITNAHPAIIALKDEATGICATVDRVICSHELGLPKEEPGFWSVLQETEPFDGARTLLIDDNHAVLEAASASGIAHLLAIEQPDSHQPGVAPGRFPLVADLRELVRN